MKLILMILLTTLISSCNPSVYFTDNTGKCFYKERELYESSRIFLVFNKNDDVVAIRTESATLYGPMENMKILFGSEVECPKEVADRFGLTTRDLKDHGVYNEVIKYINITIILN